ncbi:MAG: sugar transferase [Candidatus Pacebacteria bacterium]|nr:sugar transferase [Candidatus Paceibacterota bacterium]
MHIAHRKEPLVLLLGDVAVFVIGLWLTLFIRYAEIPTFDLYYEHIVPFSILFMTWFLVFFIFGFYEKHTLLLKSKIPTMIFHVQAINSTVAVIFFYFFPLFSITPKINLFLNLIITFLLLVLWRIFIVPRVGFGRQQNALLVGSGEEIEELESEVNNNPRYRFKFISSLDLDEIDGIDFKEEVLDVIYGENIGTIVMDLRNEKDSSILPQFYNLIYSKVYFVDMCRVYEDVFDKVPLSLVNYNWFLENMSSSKRMTYDALKRFMDVVISGVLGLLSLSLYPFIIFAIKIESKGPAFFVQKRIGRSAKIIRIRKFRTMTGIDEGDEVLDSKQEVTYVGNFLRKTRLDEIPQLWNVFFGQLSLIGPRSEIPELAKQYVKEIPYYNTRHLIKPGLSGWAQIYHDNHPHHGTNVSATKEKLSYDLYYVKNRSLILDFKIALKTLKIILSAAGV